jgi:hypothetical protein
MAGRRGALRVELGCRGGDGSTPTNVRTGVDRPCGMVFTVGMTKTAIDQHPMTKTVTMKDGTKIDLYWSTWLQKYVTIPAREDDES